MGKPSSSSEQWRRRRSRLEATSKDGPFALRTLIGLGMDLSRLFGENKFLSEICLALPNTTVRTDPHGQFEEQCERVPKTSRWLNSCYAVQQSNPLKLQGVWSRRKFSPTSPGLPLMPTKIFKQWSFFFFNFSLNLGRNLTDPIFFT